MPVACPGVPPVSDTDGILARVHATGTMYAEYRGHRTANAAAFRGGVKRPAAGPRLHHRPVWNTTKRGQSTCPIQFHKLALDRQTGRYQLASELCCVTRISLNNSPRSSRALVSGSCAISRRAHSFINFLRSLCDTLNNDLFSSAPSIG